MRFRSSSPGAASWIDIVAAGVRSATLNGIALDVSGYDEEKGVALPDLAGENELVVDADCRYMNTGEGLHRFVDPADDEVYLYSQFEVPDARRMYPVFEQPDLKATFQFTVTAPARWKVLSNEPTPQPEPADSVYVGPGGRQEATATWRFAPTPRISCYIAALVAGPYTEYRDEVEARGGTVPLGVYCRASLAPHMDAEEISNVWQFEQTRKIDVSDLVFGRRPLGLSVNAGHCVFDP